MLPVHYSGANGETGSSITVNDAATYTVTATIDGCTSAPGTGVSAPKSSPSVPVVSVTNNCGNSVLSTNATGSLQWSNGETGSSITVNDAATYTVTATIDGCTSAPGTGVSAPKSTPSAPVVSVTNNCGNSVLSTNASGSLQWSNGQTTSSITVTDAATYTVTTTVDGCTSAPGSGLSAPKAVPSAPGQP